MKQVLDHGFVELIDHMGTDESIAQAARVSYGNDTRRSSDDDRSLIRYLMRHDHTTPFEMCEIKLHVKLPVFVARQWVRHRTANVNEYSARYSVLEKEFYIPSNVARQSTVNHQGRGDAYSESQADRIRSLIDDHSDSAYALYERLNESGVAKELSRMVLPTNIYTRWYWKTDLHNLFRFIELRMDSHAQWEIQQYAKAILEIVARLWPIAFEAWNDYRWSAVKLSRMEADAIMQIINSGSNPRGLIEDDTWGQMSTRERNEFTSRWLIDDR